MTTSFGGCSNRVGSSRCSVSTTALAIHFDRGKVFDDISTDRGYLGALRRR